MFFTPFLYHYKGTTQKVVRVGRYLKLLCIFPGAIGDFILSLPVFKSLKYKVNPDLFELWVDRVNLQLAHHVTFTDKAVALSDTGIDRYPTPNVFFQRIQQFDRVLSWFGTSNIDFVQSVKKVHKQVNFLSFLPDKYNQHLTDFRTGQLENIFGKLNDYKTTPEVCWGTDDYWYAKEFLGNLNNKPKAVIHPGASGLQKQWAIKNFSDVAISLVSDRKMKMFLVQGPLDEKPVSILSSSLENSGIPFKKIQEKSLSRLAAILLHCQVYVGNDSGITHLAAVLGIPTLAIFISTNPLIWRPQGSHVRVLIQPTVEKILSNVPS